MALIITKSPTVLVPLRMPIAHITMVAVEPDGEDDRLPGIEHRERGVGLDARALVALHRAVVALGLALLGD
jgi:hypothetical protein